MGRLEDKVALITGSGSGIGRASAILFAREGAKVVVVDIDPEGGSETVHIIKDAGGEAMFVRTDVTNAEDVKNMVKTTIEEYGKLDILFNNAGILEPFGTVVDNPEEVFDRCINVNLKGVFLCSKYAIPEMAKRGGGVIVNMSSSVGLVGAADRGAYCAAKAGIVNLTRAMAADHGHQNIRVNCICPAATLTPSFEREMRERKKTIQEFFEHQIIKRVAKPEEIAYAALFLASDEASFITGSALTVDGGQTAL